MSATILKAQVSKDATILGGNLAFMHVSGRDDASNKTKTTNVSIAPSFAKAYKDNKVWGVVLKYRYSGNANPDLKTNSFGAGVFLRQYKSVAKSFYIFTQETLTLDLNQYKNIVSISYPDVIIEKQKQYSVNVAFNPGIAYDMSRKLQLELLFFNNLISAGYSHIKNTFTSSSYPDSKENSFYLSSNLDWSQLSAISIGMRIYLNR